VPGNMHAGFGGRGRRNRHPQGRTALRLRPLLISSPTTSWNECRRRVQNETMGHRGRKTDPLYRIRRLLTKADERLDERGRDKLVGLLAAGDPKGDVKETWHAKEFIRSICDIDDPDLADQFFTRLASDPQDTPPARGPLARPDTPPMENHIVAWHRGRATNGPTEAVNNLIKRIKRIAYGSAGSGPTGSERCSTPATLTGTCSPPSLPTEIRSAALPHGRTRWKPRSRLSMICAKRS